MKKIKINSVLIMIALITSMLLACISQCMTKVYAMENEFKDFSSTSYILMDKNSQTVLYALNPYQKMPVASICKLMTSYLTFEAIEEGKIDYEDMVVASEHACDAEGSQAFLDSGSKYKIEELLKSVVIASANDSAIVLAETIGGSENSFTKLMNEKAKSLGMKNTLYANATGLPAPSQYSTAYDTAIILKAISKFDRYKEFCKIWTCDFVHPSGRNTELVNTNRLVRYYDYCECGKTGFTDEAGYCLSACANNNDMELISVVLNCKDSASRFKESIQLLNYGFSNFENKLVVNSDIKLNDVIVVKNGKYTNMPLIPAKNLYIIDKKGDTSSIELKYQINDNIVAPFEKNTVVGKIIVLKNGKKIDEVEVVTLDKMDKQSFVDILTKISKGWSL